MGMRKTVNQKLPPRMVCRKRGDVRYYFYSTKGTNRKEISLGTSLRGAMEQYRIISETEDFGSVPVPSEYYKEVFRRSEKSAKTRTIEFSLSEDDVRNLYERANHRCQVSGIAFDMRQVDGVRIRPWAPSLDRINPKSGYSVQNCRFVCAAVNLSLNQFGDDVFYQIAFSIARKRKFDSVVESDFAENHTPSGNHVSDYYHEIAGAQEGTRTPTELPAST